MTRDEKRIQLADKIDLFLQQYAKKDVNGEWVGKEAFKLNRTSIELKDKDTPVYYILEIRGALDSEAYLPSGEEVYLEIVSDFEELFSSYCSNCANHISLRQSFCPFCSFRTR